MPSGARSDNWLSDRPLSEWEGVHANRDGRVTTLDLGNNRVRGPLPAILGRLEHLQRLWLGFNALTGEIPPEWASLRRLEDVYLRANGIEGSLPAWDR